MVKKLQLIKELFCGIGMFLILISLQIYYIITGKE